MIKSNIDYTLIKEERILFYNVKKFIKLDDCKKAIYNLYTCLKSNLQRRIEYFDKSDFYEYSINKIENKVANEFVNIDDQNIINYAKKSTIIDNQTYKKIKHLFLIKEYNVIIDKHKLTKIVLFLEKNYFSTNFKQNRRKIHSLTKYKRRNKDYNLFSLLKKTFINIKRV